MDKNVVVISFAEASKAYQALAELKAAALEGRVDVETAAVVQRAEDGSIQVKDGVSDGAASTGPLAGTLVGSLIGILGGPLGVFLGGMSGALIGSSVAMDKAIGRLSVLEQMMHAMPAGSTTLIATVEEAAVDVVDTLAASLGGTVLRRPLGAVVAEIEAQADAKEAAVEEARKVLRAKHKDEWRDKFDNWKEEIGDGIDKLQAKISDAFKKS
ncbi:MAG: DUF1269 domain-containing protein [Comamonas sp.]|jgi:uncharacterized membrane protein